MPKGSSGWYWPAAKWMSEPTVNARASSALADRADSAPSWMRTIDRSAPSECSKRARSDDGKGAPAKGAVLAIWQNAGNGLYAQQDPAQSPTNYHARLAVAEDGTFAFTTVRPVAGTRRK